MNRNKTYKNNLAYVCCGECHSNESRDEVYMSSLVCCEGGLKTKERWILNLNEEKCSLNPAK